MSFNIYTGDLQELLQCPVVGCDETLYAPTTLDCGHTVCSSHVQRGVCPVASCESELLDEEMVPRPMRMRIPPGSRVEYDASPAGELPPIYSDKDEAPRVNKTAEEILAFLDEQDDIGNALRPKTIFSSDLLTKLTCTYCSKLLYNPITTPCQHTFCAQCLRHSLFHSNICPLRCRTRFGGFAFWEEHPIDSLMQNLLLNFFSELTAQRAETIDALDRDALTPLFIVSLVLPGQECTFQIFEPRYRLMIRRCLEQTHKSASPSGFPTMGLMMHNIYGRPLYHGCIVEITKVQMMYDGRALLVVRGTTPFRVVERGFRDGYAVARTELLKDVPGPRASPTPRSRPSSSNERLQINDLVEICIGFLAFLRRHGQDVIDRITRAHGPPPVTEPALLSFWFARMLPVDDVEKAEMLAMRSIRDRLTRVIFWISQAAGPEPG
ncbi:PUA-like domain-containing protein [Mycena amicta]|nr:PUA-like domain-containing protein [Mycena amicta]